MLKLFLTSLPLFLVLFSFNFPVQAQANSCPEEEKYEDVEPAATTRIVEVPQFGIQVEIPNNYRTMLFQNGEVGILHPATFAYIQCVVRGDAYGRGFYGEFISTIDSKPTMGLREQAVQYMESNGSDVDNIQEYESGGLSGYILEHRGGFRGATFFGFVPDSNKILMIRPSCDCDTTLEQLMELLSNIQVLNN
ncbi:hypothetical protein PN462_23225 [Spirulina sp. CS-785/01]|uniref:hypothetical protein n=1 Tax=Spirulina sp. CS-785/01 TaxID=3021716 RepID=UPI00232BD9E6|nr:hypothetical protein [Spirulina sp. CS-785/01]MDB9316042.1 hypothetical protein [Spirulina sp. CS-785/01]